MGNLNFSRLGGSTATFQQMIQRFGVVTVMNAHVYDTAEFTLTGTTGWEAKQADEIIKENFLTVTNGVYTWKEGNTNHHLCTLDSLKVANMTQDGPTKTVTGGQYSNPLIKYGKTARCELQDALGSAAALDALCGTVSEVAGASGATAFSTDDYNTVHALHVTSDFNGPRTIVGDTFFIDQKTGQQVKAIIIIYQFLPDSLLNLTQEAEGDASVFDMNGDILNTNITIKDTKGNKMVHGAFYSIVDPADLAAA